MSNSAKARGLKQAAGQQDEQRDTTPAVGTVLRRAREHHKLSIREVERRIGRSSAYLSQIERGVIKQPDPMVLLELAELYRLNFMTLARWAGWANESQDTTNSSNSTSLLVRQILELDDKQRGEVLAYVQHLIRDGRS
jgi:transcriptional regulator with XRE-family HTH domain